jgi:hypothetical protein
MSLAADPITLKRLGLVKQFYQQSLRHSTSQNGISPIMAVIGFDLAVESLLKTIIAVLDPHSNPKAERTFYEYRDKADTLMQGSGLNSLPDKRNITHVHDLRNSCQHRAQIPSESEVSDCRTYIRDFLQQVLSQVWGLSIEGISLTDLIQHRLVKECLVKAETLFAQPDYPEAVLWALAGLNKAMDMARSSLVGHTFHYSNEALVIEKSGQQRPSRDMYQSFQGMQEIMLHTVLGLNYIECLRHQGIIRKLGIGATVYDDGDRRFYTSTALKEIDRDTAESLIRHCIDTVVQIENRAGSLDRPFQ